MANVGLKLSRNHRIAASAYEGSYFPHVGDGQVLDGDEGGGGEGRGHRLAPFRAFPGSAGGENTGSARGSHLK